jgi:hypothetical protein
MSGAVYFPLLVIVTFVISYLAVSIVLTKVASVQYLRSGQSADWVLTYFASEYGSFQADITMSNRVIYLNLDAYTAGWENGFPFLLFDPQNVAEGTSITVFNSPASNIGSTVRVTYTGQNVVSTGGNVPCSTSANANVNGGCPCPDPTVPSNVAWCAGAGSGCTGGLCTQCFCNNVCSPQNPLVVSSILGRGQGVTMVAQRRISNVNVTQPSGLCFYYDLTPSFLQPIDWVPVRYFSPDPSTQCQAINLYNGNGNPTAYPLQSGDPGFSDPNQNLCFNYPALGANTQFFDFIPSALIFRDSSLNNLPNPNPWRQNGPGPAYVKVMPNSAAESATNNWGTWQDCMANNCQCTSGTGLWCQ